MCKSYSPRFIPFEKVSRATTWLSGCRSPPTYVSYKRAKSSTAEGRELNLAGDMIDDWSILLVHFNQQVLATLSVLSRIA